MNILIITPSYPDRYKVHYPFVKQLVDEFARQGHTCSVIAPYSVTKNKRFYPTVEMDGPVTVYHPNYLSFSNLRIGNVRPSDVFRRKAIMRAAKMLPQKPDVVYCHFWECGVDAFPYASKHHIPLFVASGESSIATLINPKEISQAVRDYISGVICVSTKNKEESISLGLTTEEKCFVKPNAVNSELFKKLDKEACRKKLGFPQDAFIISFVGAFIERKGANRVAAAIMSLTGKPVYSVFVGKGSVEPDCENILFKGPLRHEEIPEYLNASDAFVLPTLKEGCCNAIVEAMSCGLPIISSNLPFNLDVLDESNSIMIDPNDVAAIARAIERLRDDKELRARMAASSWEKAKALTIDQRAKGIVDFMRSKWDILFKTS